MRYFFWIFLVLLIFVRIVTTKPVYSDRDKIRILTKVSSEPIKYDTSQRLILVGLKMYLPSYPEIGYGDKVIVEGIVEDGKLSDPKLISLDSAVGIFYKTRNNIIKVYQKSLPEPHASLLTGLTFAAQAFGRLQAVNRALFLSAALMLIVKPDWITDLGFILSFVATASLMLFERKIASLIRFVPGIFREGLSTSLAAQIGVAPILFATFGQFSLFSPIINALVLWTIAPITIIGEIGGIIGLASTTVGKVIILLSYPLTTRFVWILRAFG